MADTQAKQFLPPRMRRSMQRSGKTYFYYDTCGTDRKWIPLGADYVEALKKYAKLEVSFSFEVKNQIVSNTTFAYVADRYVKEIVPTKSPATQKDNLRELKNLLEFFNDPPVSIDAIEPVHVTEYLRWRINAKVRANREVALLSNIFNRAREWGYTANANPTVGIRKYKETGRDVYVSDELFWRVYDKADGHIQDFLLVAYLTGQRVADNLKIKLSDIRDGVLWVSQNKTGTRLRIQLAGALADVIEKIRTERGKLTHDYLFINPAGHPLTHEMLRYGFDKARRLAKIPKKDIQIRDLRAKSGTDKEDAQGLEAAQSLLGHRSPAMTQKYVRNRKGKLVNPTVMEIDSVKNHL